MESWSIDQSREMTLLVCKRKKRENINTDYHDFDNVLIFAPRDESVGTAFHHRSRT
jgi:hypothetical protein